MLTELSIRVFAAAQSFITQLRDDERGQDTLEWVMLGGLVAAAIVGIIGVFSGALGSFAAAAENCLDWDSTTACTKAF